MGKKGISNHGISSSLDEWEKALPEPKEGGNQIRSLTEATVTATTKRWKLPSPSLSKKVSGVHCTVVVLGFFFPIMVRLKGDKVRR